MFSSPHGQNFGASRRIYLWLALIGLILMLAAKAASAAAVGLLSDNQGDRVSVFNADSDQVTWEFAATPGQAVGDCAISSDQNLGITTSSSRLISFIDLTSGHGSPFASGEAQLAISNLGVDMSLSPDDAYLVTAGGGALEQPLSVIDIKDRVEIAVSSPFVDHTSVEFCDDGTLLVTTTHGRRYSSRPDNALYDAFLDDQGQIQLLGGRVSSGAQPNNAACAPGSRTGVLLDRHGGLTSFLLPSMKVADAAMTRGETGVSATFSRDGRKLYVRTSHTVEAFDFDPLSGALKAGWVRPVPFSSTYYGMDQIAIHPDGDKLYVDGGDVLLILNPKNGEPFGAIEAGDATGVCFASTPRRALASGTGPQVVMAPAP